METKTQSKAPLTIEEMRDMRNILMSVYGGLSENVRGAMARDVSWALYALDHAIERRVD